MTGVEVKSQTLSRLSHSGAPIVWSFAEPCLPHHSGVISGKGESFWSSWLSRCNSLCVWVHVHVRVWKVEGEGGTGHG